MRATLIVCALVIVASIVALAWQLDTRERRIVQLEMALAQTHAESDTLEAALESFEQGDRWTGQVDSLWIGVW